MKNWKIPVTWEVYGIIEVEAETLDEAIKIFDSFEENEGYRLPNNSYYVDDSFERNDEETCSLVNS